MSRDKQYLVYGAAWFGGRVEAGSEEEARFRIIAELLNDAGIAIKIEFIEVEVEEDENQNPIREKD